MRPRRSDRHFPNAPPLVTGLVGLGVFFCAFWLWPRGIAGSVQGDYTLFIAVIFVAMAGVELGWLRTWRQPEAGITPALFWRRSFRPDAILAHKLVGLSAGFLAVLAIYRLVGLYQDPWYQRFTLMIFDHAPLIFSGFAAYIYIIDRMLPDRPDALGDFGAFILSFGQMGDRRRIADFALSWLVKVFFLPLMYCYGLDDWHYFYGQTLSLADFTAIYEFLYRLVFLIDVVFAVIGYATAMRLFNSQIRWPERTFSGWVVCVMCYMPFWQVLGRNFFEHGDEIVWGNLFTPGSLPYMIWGTLILLAFGVYLLSTIAFGLRFSNLTYRGTIHRGPYALTRHPAYIAKNLTMWMIHLPFLAVNPVAAASNTVALIGVNLIYYARARHEERCCRGAREYRLYERHLARFGPIARLRRNLRRKSSIGHPTLVR